MEDKDEYPERKFVIHGGDRFNRQLDASVLLLFKPVTDTFTTEQRDRLQDMINSSDDESLGLAEIIIKDKYKTDESSTNNNREDTI